MHLTSAAEASTVSCRFQHTERGRPVYGTANRTLAFVRFILFSADTANEFMDRNCLYLASAVSFYTLFSIFPLMLATISAVGFVIGPWGQQDQMELARDIASVVPVSTEFVRDTVEDIVSARALTGLASILLMLVAATAVFSAIRKGVNEAWGVRESRPFLKERLMDLSLVLGAGLVLLTVLFLAPVLGILESITEYLEPEGWYFSQLFWGLASLLISPALAFVTFLALYRLLPKHGGARPGRLARRARGFSGIPRRDRGLRLVRADVPHTQRCPRPRRGSGCLAGLGLPFGDYRPARSADHVAVRRLRRQEPNAGLEAPVDGVLTC